MSLTRTTAPLIGLAALAALAMTGNPVAADTITFKNLTGADEAPAPVSYSEGNFTVKFSQKDWSKLNSTGNPGPCVFTQNDGATIDVMRSDNTLFTFTSVDLALNGDSIGYTLTGQHGIAQVFKSNNILNETNGFTALGNPDSTSLIDDLKIEFHNSTRSPLSLDNIVVQAAVPSVPEPSSIASLGLGALGLGGLVLRARKRKVHSA